MNYKKIKETCPLSWKKLLKWRSWLEIKSTGELGHYYTDVHLVQNWINLIQHDLLDFFDLNELHITINPKYFNLTIIECWVFWINDGDTVDYPETKPPTYGLHYSGLTRTDAEKEAFTEAFKLLEEQLKESK
jgi:hypothetical protein